MSVAGLTSVLENHNLLWMEMDPQASVVSEYKAVHHCLEGSPLHVVSRAVGGDVFELNVVAWHRGSGPELLQLIPRKEG